jgi:decaprenylphospho-beta-D-erythro-pentofuranosid-2-ulose 2-reductase
VDHVLILGASSDVAIACAHEFARHGYNLFLAGRDITDLGNRATDIQIRFKVSASPVFFDALDFDQHEAIYKSLSPRPAITICVFGLLGNQAISEQRWEQCLKVINSNFTGAVSILNCVANDYETNEVSGVIVGVSSVAGERGRKSNYIYGSSKSAFTAYLSGLRNRLAKSGKVHVVTVKPGFIYTKMTEGLPLPRLITATPDRVGRSIFAAVKGRKNVVYVLPVWRLIMFVIKAIPERFFKKLDL